MPVGDSCIGLATRRPPLSPAGLEPPIIGMDSRWAPLNRNGRARNAAATGAGSTHPASVDASRGCVEPDFNRVVSHKIQIISLRGTPQPAKSGAPDEFKRLATSAQEMLRLGRALDEMLFVLGQATRFVQDLNQPLHAAWGETRAEHNEIEAQMLYRAWQKDHLYRGFILIQELHLLRI